MKKFKNLSSLISDLHINKYNEKWSGYLYRAGDSGVFYHTSKEGSEFYGKDVALYECPIVNGILIDLDVDYDEIMAMANGEDDIALAIEAILPILQKRGFNCVVLDGETGAEVTGVPVEIILFDKPKPVSSIDKVADSLE